MKHDEGELKKKVEDLFQKRRDFVDKLRPHIEILETMKKLKASGKPSTPTNILTKLYSKGLKELENEEENHKLFIKKHRPTISRKLKILRENLELIYIDENRKSENKKRDIYEFTPNGKSVLDYYEIWGLPAREKELEKRDNGKEIPISARVFHSNKIRIVIERLINEFPVVGTDCVYLPSKQRMSRSYYIGQELRVETQEVLFGDLKNHLMTFITYDEFEKLFNEFGHKSKEFYESTERVHDLIKREIGTHFKDSGLEYCPNWGDAIGVFGDDMVEWVYKGVKYYADEKTRKYFPRYYIDFKLIFEEITIRGRAVLRIRVNGYCLILIEKPENQKSVLGAFEKKLKEFMGLLKTEPLDLDDVPHYKEYLETRKLHEALIDLQEKITSRLKQEREIPIYPSGDCEYLKARYKL